METTHHSDMKRIKVKSLRLQVIQHQDFLGVEYLPQDAFGIDLPLNPKYSCPLFQILHSVLEKTWELLGEIIVVIPLLFQEEFILWLVPLFPQLLLHRMVPTTNEFPENQRGGVYSWICKGDQAGHCPRCWKRPTLQQLTLEVGTFHNNHFSDQDTSDHSDSFYSRHYLASQFNKMHFIVILVS